MHNTDDHNVIRYLMKEMDPSEELEFEKQMREDEDLLIEVESLRATNKKLSDLPNPAPPEHLTNAISQKAKDIALQNSGFHFNEYLRKGIAAAVLLASFTGAYLYYYSLPANSNGSAEANKAQAVEPWVDRNDVIRFADEGPSTSPTILQPELLKSYDKLQLVNDLSSNSGSSNGILLTGSPK